MTFRTVLVPTLIVGAGVLLMVCTRRGREPALAVRELSRMTEETHETSVARTLPSEETPDARYAADKLDDERYTEALSLADACLRASPKDRECLRVKVQSLTRKGDRAAAIAALETCLRESPDDAVCLRHLITLQIMESKLSQVGGLLERLRAAAPNTVVLALSEAEYHEAKGDADKAAASLLRACELGDTFACARAKRIRDKGLRSR